MMILAGTMATAALAFGTAALAGCGGNQNKLSGTDTAEGAYAFTAATAGMIISGMEGGGAAAKTLSASYMTEVTDKETTDTLNEYMMLVESMLSDGGFGITSGDNDSADYAQYQSKMSISYRGLDGERAEYTTYYNQTFLGSHTDDDDEPWETEVTEYYAIEGVMIIDGAEYPLEGRFVNETEGRESESEQMLKVTVDRAAGDYITVVQENENEDDESETEFTYSLYRGGRLYEETTMEYESERGETEIKLTVENRETGKREMFEFEKEREHGRDIIKIKTEQNGREREYIVRIESDGAGNTGYVYYTKDGDRVGRGDRRDFDD